MKKTLNVLFKKFKFIVDKTKLTMRRDFFSVSGNNGEFKQVPSDNPRNHNIFFSVRNP